MLIAFNVSKRQPRQPHMCLRISAISFSSTINKSTSWWYDIWNSRKEKKNISNHIVSWVSRRLVCGVNYSIYSFIFFCLPFVTLRLNSFSSVRRDKTRHFERLKLLSARLTPTLFESSFCTRKECAKCRIITSTNSSTHQTLDTVSWDGKKIWIHAPFALMFMFNVLSQRKKRLFTAKEERGRAEGSSFYNRTYRSPAIDNDPS